MDAPDVLVVRGNHLYAEYFEQAGHLVGPHDGGRQGWPSLHASSIMTQVMVLRPAD